ncbi:hypothetical protein SprV_0301093200 [Sparganum proliferum]
MFKQRFLQRLPPSVQAILAPNIPSSTFQMLAETADRTLEYYLPPVTVNFGSRSTIAPTIEDIIKRLGALTLKVSQPRATSVYHRRNPSITCRPRSSSSKFLLDTGAEISLIPPTLTDRHKDGAPLQPIVSLKDTPTYGLAKWLFRRLKSLTAESDTTVSSSAHFLEKLKGLLKLCLRTYFTFDGTVYEQVKGTPMGSPISGFIAEAVLQRLESLVFQHHKPKFSVRCVDDTFVIIERDQVLTFQEHLNAVFPDIQFTMEEEGNN